MKKQRNKTSGSRRVEPQTNQKNIKKATPKQKEKNAELNREAESKYNKKWQIAIAAYVVILFALVYGNNAFLSFFRFFFGDNFYLGVTLFTIAYVEYCKRRAINRKYSKKTLQVLLSIIVFGLCGISVWSKHPSIIGIDFLKSIFTISDFKNLTEACIQHGVIGSTLYGLLTAIVGHTFSGIIFLIMIVVGVLNVVGIDNVKNGISKILTSVESVIYSDEDEECNNASKVENAHVKKSTNISKKSTNSFVNYLESSSRVQHDVHEQEVDSRNEHAEPMFDAFSSPSNGAEKESFNKEKSIKETYAKRAQKKQEVFVEEKPLVAGRPATYRKPDLKLLDKFSGRANEEENYNYAEEKGEELIKVLNDFRIEAELVCFHVGPAVTKFEIRPAAKIKVGKILELQDNIKMELAVKDVRIEAPIPGKNTIGVEIPNKSITVVKMKELLTKENLSDRPITSKLSVILGKGLLGDTVYCNLEKMPHLLVAGATGSGKSVCMNAIITSLLYRATPDEVKLLLIDPKKVEFSSFANLPHLVAPVITDAAEAARALKVVVKIMDERYDMFAKAGAKNIKSYNEKIEKGKLGHPHKFMPYMVVIIDELADLMLVAGKDVEGSIQRITQLARAAGIHLIVATQRPSTDVITGIIKANIPSRIAFAVSNGIDSKVILDRVGAEKLLGFGDMLYSPIGSTSMTRAQGVYVGDEEIERVIQFVSSQGAPIFEDAFINAQLDEEEEAGTYNGQSAKDPLYNEVKQYVIETKKASASLLQRRFGIGYNRAARLIDMLEANSVIGPAQGSKPRDVYV